ncbi:MAG: hypothetical protein IJY87_04630 [Bacilli bacterium]|nr:hypothetical protein [Bacilli bacterium]
MIIYGLLKVIILILDIISGIFGSLIPDLPDVILNLFDTFSTIIQGGVSFVSYFLYWPVIVAAISILITFHAFKIVKDMVMKVIGHFIAN